MSTSRLKTERGVSRAAFLAWAERDYGRALELMQVVASKTRDRNTLLRMARFTGGLFPIDRLATGTNPLFAQDDSFIVFVAGVPGDWRIVSAGGPGYRLQNNLICCRSKSRPHLLFAGPQIVFTLPESHATNIYRFDILRSKRVCVGTIEGRMNAPAVSKDGTRLSFVSRMNLCLSLQVLDLRTGHKICFKKPQSRYYAPSISGDGKDVYFTFLREGARANTYSIFHIDIRRDTCEELFVSKERIFGGPALSPDGRFLVFGSEFGTYAHDLRRTMTRRIFTDRKAKGNWGHSFSPDGEKIAFVSATSGGFDLILWDRRSGRCLRFLKSKIGFLNTSFVSRGRAVLCWRLHGGSDAKLCLFDRGTSDIFEIDPDVPCGQGVRVDHRGSVVSSDGKRVAFVRNLLNARGRQQEIHLLDLSLPPSPQRRRLIERLEVLRADERYAKYRQLRALAPQDPLAMKVCGQVSMAQIGKTMRDLTAIGPRAVGSKAIGKAAAYLYARFSQMGFDVVYDTFIIPGDEKKRAVNIIATLPGDKDAETIYVLCAHYDTVPRSPGALDNASGIGVLLEAARVLRGQDRRHSLKFVCFSGEEVGCKGSAHFAQRAKEEGRRLGAVLNIDAVGYPRSKGMDISICCSSVPMGFLLQSVSSKYTDLSAYLSAAQDRSDTGPFRTRFGNITARIEDYPGLISPYVHTPRDTQDHVSLKKLKEVAKLVAVSSAFMSLRPRPVENVRVVRTGRSGRYRVLWDAVRDPDVSGYRIFHGSYPDIYRHNELVGNTGDHILRADPAKGLYALGVTACGRQGEESWGGQELYLSGMLSPGTAS